MAKKIILNTENYKSRWQLEEEIKVIGDNFEKNGKNYEIQGTEQELHRLFLTNTTMVNGIPIVVINQINLMAKKKIGGKKPPIMKITKMQSKYKK